MGQKHIFSTYMEKLKSIQVLKTYHYDELGDDSNSQNKCLWIVAHGYGQLVSFFKRKFEGIDLTKHHLVFPEAGNHYYLQGFNGRIGANWMTKHERLDKIDDINRYLSSLLNSFEPQRYKRVILLGFSQGAYSLIRWWIDHEVQISRMILWGAHIAEDYLDRVIPASKEVPIHLALGTNDELIMKDQVSKTIELYRSRKMQFSLHEYDGGHDIHPETLLELSRIVEE